MPGLAFVVPEEDYSSCFIEKVSFLNIVNLQSLSLVCDNTYIGNSFTVDCNYFPPNASRLQCHVRYSIIDGNEYATIDEKTGVVTILANANYNSIIIKAQNTYNEEIYDTKTVTLVSNRYTLNDITSLSYIGIGNNLLQFTPIFDPIDTFYNNVSYSIISGNEYAYIGASTGILEVLNTAEDESDVTVRCISNYNSSLYKDLDLTIKYSEDNYHRYYEELAYISSTLYGGQYIDTGFKAMENTDDMYIETVFNIRDHINNTNQQSTIIGGQIEKSPYSGFVCRTLNKSVDQSYNYIQFTTKWDSGHTGTNDSGRYHYVGWASSHSVYNTVDRPVKGQWELINIPAGQCHNQNLLLFGTYNSSNIIFRQAVADMYYFKLTKGGQLALDLIPVRRKSDNAVGLYDKVNDHLYTSQSNTPFYAKDIIIYKSIYKKVECIKSTAEGNQYIDLGCKLFENTDDIQIDISLFTYYEDKVSNIISCNDESNNQYPGLIIWKDGKNNVKFECSKQSINTINVTDKMYNTSSTDNPYTMHSTTYSNENTIIISNIQNSDLHNRNMVLFCGLDSSGNPFRFAHAELYYLKITKGGVLIRDLEPVIRTTDNICGLYDKVEEKFYPSQGTNQFEYL